MDPAPQSHPILSYVLSRLPTLSNPRPASGGGDFDIEQPHVQTPSPRTPSSAGEFDLVERMPGLRHPSVLRAMTRAVADVSAARSALQLLGPRPDHELVDSSRALITAVAAGDSQITAFAFSKENWSRPKVEVDFLMRLFERVIHDRVAEFSREGIRLRVIGDCSRLPVSLQKTAREAEEATRSNSQLDLILAISYSGRRDIVQACRNLAHKVHGKLLRPEDINESLFADELETSCADEFPYPDLLIRTSGELRLSNFLLWQSAYSELFFTNTLWPDFGEADYLEALNSFQGRERRFGLRKL